MYVRLVIVLDCQSGYSYHQQDNKSREVAYVVVNVRQLFCKHRVSKIVLVGCFVGGTDGQK